MSKRGREKKGEHVRKVREQKKQRLVDAMKEAVEHARGQKKLRETVVRGKASLGMAPPWRRKIIEAIKKRNERRGQ